MTGTSKKRDFMAAREELIVIAKALKHVGLDDISKKVESIVYDKLMTPGQRKQSKTSKKRTRAKSYTPTIDEINRAYALRNAGYNNVEIAKKLGLRYHYMYRIFIGEFGEPTNPEGVEK